MKVLIDECAPRALRNFLTRHGHECSTVQEAGWSGKQNGELLELAESRFDVLAHSHKSEIAAELVRSAN